MRIAIYSNMEGSSWGASEELWCAAAKRLARLGHRVFANCKAWSTPAPALLELKRSGVRLHLRHKPEKVHRNLKRSLRLGGLFRGWLRRTRPDLVLLNSATHVGDVALAHDCRAMGIPYTTLLHSLPPHDWYRERDIEHFGSAFAGAERCFFVSRSLQEMLEERLARHLPQGRVVANPLTVPLGAPLPWPDDAGGVRLACVARCQPAVKGHDLILRVLADERWRRPLRVSFYGAIDDGARHLMRLARMHGVASVIDFPGYAESVSDIWANHHGLLLPSRHDGVPMATVEALACGRPVVASRVGRNEEFVDDGETGYLMPAATAPLLDAALERAWRSRSLWPAMGRLAAERVAERFPQDPVGVFCQQLAACAPGAASPESPVHREAA